MKKAAIPQIRFRLHRQGPELVLAAADEDVLGKKHSGGGRVLDLAKYASFYGEQSIDADGLAEHLQACTSANLVGEKAVGAALSMGLADGGQVIRIGTVPHLQLYKTLD
jgi:hypothetical protein